MAIRYPSLRQPPLALVRVGVPDASPAETAAVLAASLGQDDVGFEGRLWLTSDNQPVVHHDPMVRVGVRRRPLADLPRARVPDVVGVDQLYEAGGNRCHLALSTDDDAAARAAVAVAREAGGEGEARLWLRASGWHQAASWRALSEAVRLVDDTRLRRLDTGPERRAAALSAAGVDAVQLPEADWTAGLTTLFHRFGRLAFSGPAAHRRQLDAVLAMGVDAVSSDHGERLVEAMAALAGEGSPTTDPGRSAATP